jgi:hypothetical protein
MYRRHQVPRPGAFEEFAAFRRYAKITAHQGLRCCRAQAHDDIRLDYFDLRLQPRVACSDYGGAARRREIMPNLANQRIAILVASRFEQVELTEPKKALEQAGATTDIVSPESGKVKGWKETEWGDEFTVEAA